mgnify:CR=1 FL=1
MIYVLEDDANIRKLVDYALTREGYSVEGFGTPAEFWAAVGRQIPQLVLLDIMLPQEDGLSVLQKLRSRSDTRRLPVIMLTARSSEFDKVTGLDSGADDYIAKPFGMMELISRIRAVLRRTGPETEEKSWRIGSLYVQPGRHIVQAGGVDVALTYKEYELLRFFIENPGKVLTREELMNRVWNTDFSGESRTLDIHIRTLRQKLGCAGNYIHTVRKVGYQLTLESGTDA